MLGLKAFAIMLDFSFFLYIIKYAMKNDVPDGLHFCNLKQNTMIMKLMATYISIIVFTMNILISTYGICLTFFIILLNTMWRSFVFDKNQ